MDLHLLDRSYREEPVVGRRSGLEGRLGLSQTFFFGSGDRSLRLGVSGGRRSAGASLRSLLVRGAADVSLPLYRNRLGLDLSGSWQRDDYSDRLSDIFFFSFVYDPYDPKFGPLEPNAKRRQDTTLRAGAALSWTVLPSLRVTSRLSWINRDSNLRGRFVTLDYRRTIVSFGASWLF